MNHKQEIAQRYIALVEAQKTSRISITQLCQSLNIARKTFYHHFHDKYDLIAYIIKTYHLDLLEHSLELKFPVDTCITVWYDSFYRYKAFYTILLRTEERDILSETLLDCLPAIGDRHYRTLIRDEAMLSYVSYKFAVMQAALLKKWIAGGMAESSEFMRNVYMFPIGSYVQDGPNTSEK